jgi:sodium-dependent dicarboxylate transporter 2/3/5
MKSLCIDTERCKKAAKSLGRMTTGEKTVLAILFMAITLWMLPSIFRVFAEGNPGLSGANDLLSQIMPESMPAVLVILAIGLIRIKKEPVLRWNEIVDGIDWNVVFLFGGGIALGIGLEASGFASWIADAASASLGTGASERMIFAVASIIGFSLSYVASNTAAALIACPIAAEIALGAGLNPIGPIIGAGLACSISTALPSTTPPMAIVYSSGYVRIWERFQVGIVSDLLRLVVLIALGPLLVGLIL